MPIRLTLVAHAETNATRRGVFPLGSERLDAPARAEAARRAGMLPKGATALSSPAMAARETATALGFDAVVEPALAGLDVGAWAGQSVMDIGMTDAKAATAWIEDPAFAGHGGESIDMLIARIGTWLAARQATNDVMVAVTHAAVVRAAALVALDAPAASFWRIDVAPLAALTLSSDGQRWTLRELGALAPKS